jgi:hypothetical protein
MKVGPIGLGSLLGTKCSLLTAIFSLYFDSKENIQGGKVLGKPPLPKGGQFFRFIVNFRW